MKAKASLLPILAIVAHGLSGPVSVGPSLNPLVANVKMSKTVEVFGLVKQMQAAGEKVVSLCVGEPDFPPPSAVVEATVDAVRSGVTTYTAVTGTLELRSAIASDLRNRKGVEYDTNDIVVANGAKQAVYQGVLALCGPGDEVIIPAPYWPSYPEMVALTGAKPVIVPTSIDNEFLIDPEDLAAAITPRTKMMIFCNPSNPTGSVHDEALMNAIADVIRPHSQLAVLSDEIYERLVYNKSKPHVSFAKLPGMYDRTLTVNGFSKAYAMTGYRLGYLAGPTKLAKACTTIQSQLTSCASSISQAAGVAALTKVSEDEMEKNVQNMVGKRDYVIERLQNIEGVKSFVPDGAFYVLPDVGKWFGGDDAEFCLTLLKEKGVALVPGSSFGCAGTVRISYATSMEELEEAMDKIEEFLHENK